MIERDLALRILGSSRDADENEIQSAYRLLRGHVEARLAESDSRSFREARREELRDLERALRSLSSVPVPRGYREREAGERSASGRRRPLGGRGRLLLGWAIIATLCAAGLVAYLFGAPGAFGPAVLFGGSGRGGGGGSGGFAIEDAADPGEGSEQGASGEVESAGGRARLVARSSVEGSVLQVETRGEVRELVAEGAADETVYWLAPGDYALRVAHADCPDGWERELTVRAGEHHEFAPQLCEGTGWLVVRSNQPDDELSIDGRKLGATTPARHALTIGEHEVRVEKAGYEPWEGLIDVEPGKVVGIRPRLARRSGESSAQAAKERRVAAARPRAARENGSELTELGGWHQEAMQWLLARYDDDRSGLLDSAQELEQVPCEHWLSLEESHDSSGLGLSLTRFYGFDGERWKSNALGVADEVRDVAYRRMKECGLK